MLFACPLQVKKKIGIKDSFQVFAWVISHVGSKLPCVPTGWQVPNLLLRHLVHFYRKKELPS